jgi:hypothetical protein
VKASDAAIALASSMPQCERTHASVRLTVRRVFDIAQIPFRSSTGGGAAHYCVVVVRPLLTPLAIRLGAYLGVKNLNCDTASNKQNRRMFGYSAKRSGSSVKP